MILSDLRQDLLYGARSLKGAPGFFTVAVLTVGLGIGASTAVFSVVDALLLRPLPFREPDRLVQLANTVENAGLAGVTFRTGNLRDWRRLCRSFESLTGYFAFFDFGSNTLTGDGEAERVVGVPVAQDFLEVLGVRPHLGRNFVEEEGTDGGRRAVILGHGFWLRRYGGDPGVVGTAITLNDEPTTVVGVLPASFDFASIFSPGARVDFLAPFPISDRTDGWGNTTAVIGRLAPGTTVRQAQAELDLVNQQLQDADPARWGLGGAVGDLGERITGRHRRMLLMLAAAVGVVLLIVCANLSNLLLARSSSRRREMALRSALGAGRSRLVRQLLTESVLLSACGAVLGVALAHGITRAVAASRAFSIPRLESVTVDGTALLFALGTAVLTGLVFGVLPALQVSGVRAHEPLSDANRGSSETRARAWTRELLVVAEVALACLLVVGAGLLLRSFATLLDVDLGFRPEQAVAWRIETGRGRDIEERRAFYDRLLERVQAVPGVDSAGLTDTLPLGRNRSWAAMAQGEVYADGEAPSAFPRIVSPGYLETMGIERIAGRPLSAHDGPDGEQVMIINATMAERLWPGRDPLGRIATLGGDGDWQVVGVVDDVRHSSLEESAGLEAYLPMRQSRDWGSMELVVRSRLPLETVVTSVRGALRELDPNLPTAEFRTLDSIIEQAVSPRRFLLLLIGSFALTALLLAALGIYGVVSYSVSRRTQEIGIRMALGESPVQVRRRFVGKSLRLAAIGVLAGTLGAFALSKLMSSLLFGIGPTDPLTYGLVVLALILTAAMAAFLPARRASQTDPARVLSSV
jgi:predicted permease